MQDRYEDLRVKVKALPGSRRSRAAMIGVDHSTLGRFERGVSQTLATILRIEKGLAVVAETEAASTHFEEDGHVT